MSSLSNPYLGRRGSTETPPNAPNAFEVNPNPNPDPDPNPDPNPNPNPSPNPTPNPNPNANPNPLTQALLERYVRVRAQRLAPYIASLAANVSSP